MFSSLYFIYIIIFGVNCWHNNLYKNYNRLNSVRRGILTEYKYYQPSKHSKVGLPPSNDEVCKIVEKTTHPEDMILSKSDPLYMDQVKNTKYYIKDSFKQGIINCPSFTEDYIQIATITKVHGLKGHVRAISYGYLKDEQVLKSKYLFLQFDENNEFPLELEYGKPLNGSYLLKFKGIDSSVDAARLIGAGISIPTQSISMPNDNVYLIQDLLGMKIYLYSDPSKTCLGTIVDCISRHDIAFSKELEPSTDDLLELELDVSLSLTQLQSLINQSNNINSTDIQEPVTLLDNDDLESADNIYNDMEEGVAYVKTFKCSECTRTFTTTSLAESHKCTSDFVNTSEDINDDLSQINENALGVIPLDQMIKQSPDGMKRVFVPLDKDKTVRVIDVPTNSVYIDTFTVFLAESS